MKHVAVLFTILLGFSIVTFSQTNTSQTITSVWGNYINTNLSGGGITTLQVTVNGQNSLWTGTFNINGINSYTPNPNWNNANLTSWSGYNANKDDVAALIMSNTPTTGFGGTDIILKFASPAAGSAVVSVVAFGANVSGLSLSSSTTMPFSYEMASSTGTYNIYTKGNNVGIGTTKPNARHEVFSTGDGIEIEYLASKLNNLSPVPVYGFDVTNGSEARSIKGGIGFERWQPNGGGSMHFYVASNTNQGSNISGNRNILGDIKMTIDYNGNVGIGIATPKTKLHVNVGSELNWNMTTGTNGLTASLRAFNNAANGFVSGEIEASSLSLNATSGGSVGIGTINPQAKLDVNGNIQISNSTLPMGLITEVGGTMPLLNMSLNFRETFKRNDYRGASFRIDSRTGLPLYQWLTRSAGESDENIIMSLSENGNLYIGNSGIDFNDDNYKLFVENGIRTRKIKVDQTAWADYVFAPTYKLLPLQDLETYIKQNQHLPDVPSATEVAKNGIDLGDNQAVLLKKIEELTLYMIEQSKQLETQRE